MSKKEGKKMESIKDRVIGSDISNNCSRKVSKEICNYIEKLASYGFNHCNAISNASVSFRMVLWETNNPSYCRSVYVKV